jgi:hypothetical protein
MEYMAFAVMVYKRNSSKLIPLEGEVGWEHPEGTRLYFKGRITEINYEFAP